MSVCKGIPSRTDTLLNQVTIVQKNFNLLRKDHALEFLRQMYNFGPEMSVLEDNLDTDKKKALESIQDAGRKMKSLTATQQPQRTPSSSATASLSQIESITEEAADAIFENDKVLAIMEESGCDITGVSYDVDINRCPRVVVLTNPYFFSILILQ